MKKILPFALGALLVTGCANQLYPSLHYYMKDKRLPPVATDNFPHCQGYGCPTYKNVILNKHDWSIIEKAYGGKAQTAAEEREKAAAAIGAFERVVGPLTGTEVDVKGTFTAMGRGQRGKGQLDCVDESTNTTIYLMLLKQKGLLNFHEIEQPQVRWPIISGRGWMHQTAAVTEKATGEQFAIDSWFEDNGAPAWVVPLPAWRDGWHPENQAEAETGGHLAVAKPAKSP
jgi:hypothetical protein